MNLVKQYTCNGPMWVDADQLAYRTHRLTIYTSRGNRKSDVAKTKEERERAEFGVHPANLFATLAEAMENRERILAGGCVYAELFKGN